MTVGYTYTGNLSNDAKILGIPVLELREMLTKKVEISSCARQLFKRIVPEDERAVNKWDDLSEGVLLKEELLLSKYILHTYLVFGLIDHVFSISLDFLQSYFGPLKVDKSKLHKSIVGCLRNDRGKQKKNQQQQDSMMVGQNDGIVEQVTGIDDTDDYE